MQPYTGRQDNAVIYIYIYIYIYYRVKILTKKEGVKVTN